MKQGTPPLRRLRRFAILEGATLIGLVLIAVPLKRLAGVDAAVSVIGPIHGFTFLVYIYLVFEAWGARDLTRWLALRCFVAALIPFGTWLNDRALERRARSPDMHVGGCL
ncbi:MAG: DUF3817 domain-containing protein [Pseudomonadota bacterium]